jgi:hypothetical protein
MRIWFGLLYIKLGKASLGLPVSSFHDIGKSALAFHSLPAAQIAQQNNSNNYEHSGNNNNSINDNN